MKRTLAIDIKKDSLGNLDRQQRLNLITQMFLKSYTALGEFLVEQIVKSKKEPKVFVVRLRIHRAVPLKRCVRLTVVKGSLDKLSKDQRRRTILRMFLDAYGGIGKFCLKNICLRKREPRKVVIMVYMR